MTMPILRLYPAALVALLLAACAKHEPPPEPIRPVQLKQVKQGGSADTAVFAGEIRPRHEADLGFRIGGKLVARYVDVGAKVTKGQQLARLDPADTALQADAQKAAVAAAETEYRFAKAEYERYQNLYNQKFISESALDQKKNAFISNQAKFQQQRAQLAVTNNQASYATLVADQDGVITAINAEVGQVVTSGQPVMRLAREDEREVAIAVPENRIGELKSAKEIAIVLWADPAKLHPGRVREIAPAVDPATRTFAVRVSLADNDPAAQWGMTANVVLREPGSASDALLPLTSIYHAPDGKPAVWIYDPQAKTVSLRAVGIGQYREDGVIITSGLKSGEWVVSAGVNKLQSGQTVRPYDGGAAPPPVANGG
jgi:multidrug efflux system membrane fusion protein